MPLSSRVDGLDDESMLLAVLLTAGFVGLLVVMGWLTDELLGGQTECWARRVLHGCDAATTPDGRPPDETPAAAGRGEP